MSESCVFLNRKIPTKVSDQFSDEVNKAIESLKDLNQRINNRNDVRSLFRMQRELKDEGEMSPEVYLWWVNRYYNIKKSIFKQI